MTRLGLEPGSHDCEALTTELTQMNKRKKFLESYFCAHNSPCRDWNLGQISQANSFSKTHKCNDWTLQEIHLSYEHVGRFRTLWNLLHEVLFVLQRWKQNKLPLNVLKKSPI